MLAELDDVSDGVIYDGKQGLPKLSSSGGPCGLKIAVPILLKGFGSTDLERWLASSRAPSQLAKHSSPPWSERVATGVWRGSSRTVLPEETCAAVPNFTRWEEHPRGRLVTLSRRHPELIDAGYTDLEKLPGGNSTPVPTVEPLRWDSLRRFKYQVEVDGHGYQASLLAKLLMGSAVVTQRSHWPLWFEHALQPDVHVVRVRSDLRDLPAKIRSLRADDARAREIARRGREVAHSLLRSEFLVPHIARLLARYRKLFTDAPPPLAPLFASLCAGGTRSCSVYNHSAPPPRFARLASHRYRRQGTPIGATTRIRCPTPHFGDSSMQQCDSWCALRARAEHCTWCKCGGCSFCGGRTGSSMIEVPAGFAVA